MKNTITKTRTILERINKLYEAKDQISDLEDKVAENIQLERQKEKQILRNEGSLRDFCDTIKLNNICIIGVPEGEEREKGFENVFEEIMTENFPNLVREVDIQVKDVQSVPKKINPKSPIPRYVIIKMPMLKHKGRILKAARER